MQRANYYNYIEERLMTLCWRTNFRGKLNILDYHSHSENFYRDLLNLLFDWNLINVNSDVCNVEAIDLRDDLNKIIIQVSAVATKNKINESLCKPLLKECNGFTFKFISIAKSAKNLKSKVYSTPDNLNFNSQDDIFDVCEVLKNINGLDIDKLKNVYEFIRKELGTLGDPPKLQSELVTIINLLALENLNEYDMDCTLNSFDIVRKIEFNKLDASRMQIEDYKIYNQIVADIYSSFDRMGQNKSLAVLNVFRKEYGCNVQNYSGDELYNKISSNIIERLSTYDLSNLSREELVFCVDILMVDAFIRCKIFQNPNNYALTR